MIDIKIINGEIKITGTFDFGYMGIYKENQINIYSDMQEIRSWDIVTSKFGTADCSDDEIADFLTEYYNEFERKIHRNRKQVNDNFLLKIITDMEACGLPFWEFEEITVSDALPQQPDEEIYEPHWDITAKLNEEYDDTPNDGTVEKTDVETTLKELYPMFNWDKLIESIVPEDVGLLDDCVSFQCSDNFGAKILCGAYDNLDARLTFTDWHNF